MTYEDPAIRAARVREETARETAKLADLMFSADANGYTGTEPTTGTPSTTPEPGKRLPAPNPAQGSSASGDIGPDIDEQIRAAQNAGQWGEVVRLQTVKAYAIPGPVA